MQRNIFPIITTNFELSELKYHLIRINLLYEEFS